MEKRIFHIEDFEARKTGRIMVELYPFRGDRFHYIKIEIPRYDTLLTGKKGFVSGGISVPSSQGQTSTIKRSVRFGRAIIAAAGWLMEERFKVKGTPK